MLEDLWGWLMGKWRHNGNSNGIIWDTLPTAWPLGYLNMRSNLGCCLQIIWFSWKKVIQLQKLGIGSWRTVSALEDQIWLPIFEVRKTLLDCTRLEVRRRMLMYLASQCVASWPQLQSSGSMGIHGLSYQHKKRWKNCEQFSIYNIWERHFTLFCIL